MSIVVSTDVFWDRCPQWNSGHTITGSRVRGRAARKIAKRQGWHIGRSMDLCPDCAKVTAWPESLLEDEEGEGS